MEILEIYKRPADSEGFGNISPLKREEKTQLKRKNSDNSFNSVMTGMTGLTKVTGIQKGGVDFNAKAEALNLI